MSTLDTDSDCESEEDAFDLNESIPPRIAPLSTVQSRALSGLAGALLQSLLECQQLQYLEQSNIEHRVLKNAEDGYPGSSNLNRWLLFPVIQGLLETSSHRDTSESCSVQVWKKRSLLLLLDISDRVF